jgi:hypothetical protein
LARIGRPFFFRLPSPKGASSNNGRPQAGVAIAGEVTDILGGDNDLITRLADCRRASRQDDVGIERVGRGRGYATLAGVSPEKGSLTPGGSRYWLIGQSSLSDQFIETTE